MTQQSMVFIEKSSLQNLGQQSQEHITQSSTI